MKLNSGEILMLLFYISLVSGILILFSGSFQQLRMNKKESALMKKAEDHVDRILTVITDNEDRRLSAEVFLFISVLIFVFVTVTLIRYDFGLNSLISGLIFALMPYGYIRMRLINIRLRSSHEGEILISELLNQYKINFRNMIEAVDQSISCLDRAPLSKTLLYRAARRLKTYKNPEELREILDDFVYGINTDWSKILANNIYAAIAGQADVTAGLEDLLSDCRDITQLLESDKRNNLESGVIVKFLGPAMYFGLMWTSYRYMGFSVSGIATYQLASKEGLGMLIIIIISAFVSVAFITILANRKYEF